MYQSRIFFTVLFCISSLIAYTQTTSPIGLWKTIDDVTGEAKSYVEIYEDNNKLYGKIAKLLQKPSDTKCDSCQGDKKNQPLIGMLILEGMMPYKDHWAEGTIMDPENGKDYKCKIYMDSDNKLRVRGYIGFEFAGRNQFWERV